MLLTYRILEQIAKTEFSDIVKNTALIGGKSAQPNKLRVFLIDGSFLDIWLSVRKMIIHFTGSRGLCGDWFTAGTMRLTILRLRLFLTISMTVKRIMS